MPVRIMTGWQRVNLHTPDDGMSGYMWRHCPRFLDVPDHVAAALLVAGVIEPHHDPYIAPDGYAPIDYTALDKIIDEYISADA